MLARTIAAAAAHPVAEPNSAEWLALARSSTRSHHFAFQKNGELAYQNSQTITRSKTRAAVPIVPVARAAGERPVAGAHVQRDADKDPSESEDEDQRAAPPAGGGGGAGGGDDGEGGDDGGGDDGDGGPPAAAGAAALQCHP